VLSPEDRPTPESTRLTRFKEGCCCEMEVCMVQPDQSLIGMEFVMSGVLGGWLMNEELAFTMLSVAWRCDDRNTWQKVSMH
jgi:hypothetical protein